MNSPIYRVVLRDKKKVCQVLEETAVGKYEQIPSKTLGEPTFVNPNSYETCTEILRKIGKEAGIERCGGTQRKALLWYVMVYHSSFVSIIKETFMCATCNMSIFKKENYINHCMEAHNK